MKNTLLSALAILIATLIFTAMPTDAEAEIYSDTLRLHILAASDSEEDQALKLTVRDKILEKYGSQLSCYSSIEEANEKIRELLPLIEQDSERWIIEEGKHYSVKCTLTTEWYDTREYEDFTLPRGYYSSLRVIIGEGEGKNWWCVMYPPLCLDIATENAPSDDATIGYTDSEINLISKKGYNVKFKLLETFSEGFFKK